MTKAVTLIALACLLVAGAAANSILGRDSVPAALVAAAAPIGKNPVANRASKQDRLTVAAQPAAPVEPPPTATLNETLRQAFASTAPVDIEPPKITAPDTLPVVPLKPKLASKPPAQKPYALLSDVQIAGIKERLRLSSDQEYYWPAVENALRAVARKIHATRESDPHATAALIDPEAAEVQQLKSGGDAAVVPVARGPEAGSPQARPHHRPGKGRRADLRGLEAVLDFGRKAVEDFSPARPASGAR